MALYGAGGHCGEIITLEEVMGLCSRLCDPVGYEGSGRLGSNVGDGVSGEGWVSLQGALALQGLCETVRTLGALFQVVWHYGSGGWRFFSRLWNTVEGLGGTEKEWVL